MSAIRLTIQRKALENDNFDEHPEQWEEVRVEWFNFTTFSAREFIQAQQVQSTATHKAECPYFVGANSSMRLVTGDRIFHVDSVLNRNEGNRKLDWVLTEVNG